VDIRLEGDTPTISGEKHEAEQQKEDLHVMEGRYGRFWRSMQLPFAPNPDHVRADFENGVLTIRMPEQAQQERSRRIEVRTGGTEAAQPAVTQPQQAGTISATHH